MSNGIQYSYNVIMYFGMFMLYLDLYLGPIYIKNFTDQTAIPYFTDHLVYGITLCINRMKLGSWAVAIHSTDSIQTQMAL